MRCCPHIYKRCKTKDRAIRPALFVDQASNESEVEIINSLSGPTFGRSREHIQDTSIPQQTPAVQKQAPSKGRRVFVNRLGQTEKEAAENIRIFGCNTLTKKKKMGFFRQLLSNFNDPIIKILIGALLINALVSMGRMNIPETLGIVAAILIATLVSTISEYGSSLAFDRLSGREGDTLCMIRRAGEIREVRISDIAVGDIVLLRAGMSIPADGVLISGGVSCNQAAITGESVERRKVPAAGTSFDPAGENWQPSSPNQLFRGSGICSGEGEMAVLRVGDSTFIGEVASSLQEDGRPSPLKHRLSELAKSISFMGYVGAFMIAFAYLFNAFVIDSGMDLALMMVRLQDRGFLLSEIIKAITVAVSVVVVAVPEGLPMMITVVLSSNMKRMLKNGVLVRRLVGIETAGSLNILFTDKTGTLTTGKMTVCGIYGGNFSFKNYSQLKSCARLREKISECAVTACAPGGGSGATEKAVLAAVQTPVHAVCAARLPFDSDRKYSASLVKADNETTSYFLGAPERLLGGCTKFMDAAGSVQMLDATGKYTITQKLQSLGEASCRVISCAMGNAEAFSQAKSGKEPTELIFLCLLAIQDPVRSEVRRAVADAQHAGIQVVMVTGDNPATAGAVARETGILTSTCNRILPASQLSAMRDEEIKEILPQIAVISRALPSDKIRLVRIAKDAGLVAGMTGDGINDAPALKAADVGFAMGSGTDIAKESGDIVITDDSFSSITKAVLYGRTIFESIRKFVVFQLMMNLCAMGVSLIGPFMGIDSPVTVIQMLWVNIIMDTLGGLAFAGEPALRRYMLRPSLPRDAGILNGAMINQIVFSGLYSLGLCIFFLQSDLLRSRLSGGSEKYYLTVFFAMFIFCGIFNSFNARTPQRNLLSHISANKPFILIMTAVAVIQLMIIYFGGEVFRCVPLHMGDLLFAALLAATVIPADLIRKSLFQRRKKKTKKFAG